MDRQPEILLPGMLSPQPLLATHAATGQPAPQIPEAVARLIRLRLGQPPPGKVAEFPVSA